MEKNTVILDLDDYNELRDFYDQFTTELPEESCIVKYISSTSFLNNGKFKHIIRGYGIISKEDAIKALHKELEESRETARKLNESYNKLARKRDDFLKKINKYRLIRFLLYLKDIKTYEL